jgi:hypothetical protein
MSRSSGRRVFTLKQTTKYRMTVSFSEQALAQIDTLDAKRHPKRSFTGFRKFCLHPNIAPRLAAVWPQMMRTDQGAHRAIKLISILGNPGFPPPRSGLKDVSILNTLPNEAAHCVRLLEEPSVVCGCMRNQPS